MATMQIGIMHSGTQGKHDKHIKAITDGIKSLGLSDTGPHPDFKVAHTKYGNDQPLDTIAQNLDSDTAINLIVAAGGTASALAAKNATSVSGKRVVFTSVGKWPAAVANMTGIIAQTTGLTGWKSSLLFCRRTQRSVYSSEKGVRITRIRNPC